MNLNGSILSNSDLENNPFFYTAKVAAKIHLPPPQKKRINLPHNRLIYNNKKPHHIAKIGRNLKKKNALTK